MTEMKIPNGKVSFKNPNQIINMGGPWVGDFFVDDIFITSNTHINNIILDMTASQLFFVKYHDISKWQKDNYFTVNYLDLNRNRIYEFERKFENLFLGKFISQTEMEIFNAFHQGELSAKSIFNIQKEKKK